MTLSRHFCLVYPCLSALFFFCIANGFSQTTVLWSDPVEVAPNGLGAASARIALTADGDPYVLWGQSGSTPSIQIARWQNGGFLIPQTLNTTGFLPGIYDFGGLDLAAQGNSVYVVFENIISGIYLMRSIDGGQTFELPDTVYKPAPGRIVTLPSVTTDMAGNPLVSYLFESSNESNAVYHLARSTDGGLSFLPPVEASAPADGDYVCECCPSDISTRGDSVWLAFRNLRPGSIRDVWVSNSDNQGAKFGTAVDVDDTDWVQNVCPSSGPRIQLCGDTLVSVWMSKGTGTTRVHGSVTNLNTGIAQPNFDFTFSGAFGIQNRPDIAGNADTLGVVWEESGIPGNSTDVMFAFSSTGGSHLPHQIVNLTNAPGTQKTPALAYHQGFFHLVYADVLTNRLWYRKGMVAAASPTTIPETPPAFTVFPNPASYAIQLNWQTPGARTHDFQLINTLGQTVRNWQQVSPGQFLSLEGLQTGQYLIQCMSMPFFTEKIMLQAP